MWFDILKNEMRSINLPKFKVKPFNANKPDEEDDDCERKVKEIEKKFYDRQFFNQSELSSLEEKIKNPYFNVLIYQKSYAHLHRLSITYIPKPEMYPNYTGNYYFRIRVVIDNASFAETFGDDTEAKTFGETKISEESYCRILDVLQRDVEFKSEDGTIIYFTKDSTGNDNDGTFGVRNGFFSVVDSFERVRGLVHNNNSILSRMDCDLDVDLKYNTKKSDMYKNNYTFKQEVIRDGLDLIAEYINNINIKFTE